MHTGTEDSGLGLHSPPAPQEQPGEQTQHCCVLRHVSEGTEQAEGHSHIKIEI